MSEDQPEQPNDDFPSENLKNTLDYVPRAEIVDEGPAYGEAVDEVVGGGRKSGGGLGVWLAVGGVGCLLVVVMCAGVIGFGVYKAQEIAGQMFTNDPDTVRERTVELAEIDIPDTFVPGAAFQLPDFISDLTEEELPFRWTVYTRNDARGYLALGYGDGGAGFSNAQIEMQLIEETQFEEVQAEDDPQTEDASKAEDAVQTEDGPPSEEGPPAEELAAGIDIVESPDAADEPSAPNLFDELSNDVDQQAQTYEGILRQFGESHRQIEIIESETREFTIGGQDVEFTFSRGTDGTPDDEFWQISGQFEGKLHPTWLIIQVEAEAYDEAEIEAIIGSIQ
jgi:hypothetical protein